MIPSTAAVDIGGQALCVNLQRYFIMIPQAINGSFPAAVSNNHIDSIAEPDTPPEMGVWEKIADFFCSTDKSEALECIRMIFHPSVGTTRESVVSRFERLRMLAYAGYGGNIESGRHGENHLCILGASSGEILSVSLDDAGKYTVKCQGHNETHNLSPGTELRAEDYEAVWSAWEKTAPPEESCHRAVVVQKMQDCLNNGNPALDLSNFDITSLPDRLPPNMVSLNIDKNRLTSLPELPSGLQSLRASSNRLTSLPELPSGLYILEVDRNRLGYLPELPPELLELMVDYNELASLPELPPGLQELAVKSNRLDSLPTLPSGLLRLTATDNALTSLPELPSGLFELVVNNNDLACLPELPSGIQELMVNNNALTRLPELPSGLKRLWANHNDLTSLPALPSGLQALTVIQNRLTSLPALPSGLLELTVNDNRLASLPELPPGLQVLTVNDNELIRLPELPSGLQMLTVNNNELTSLPESIAHLFAYMWVDLSGNLLSMRTRQALQDMTHDPDYSGPRIHFDMGSPFVLKEPRPLHQAVADWLVPAGEGEPRLAGKWQAFEQQDDAASFSSFLDRLSETENFKKDSGFKTQIAFWLTQLVEDDELRAKTFAMATEATSSCEDRVTFALNKMKNVQLVHNAEKGAFNDNLPGLVSVGREMFRLEKLEQIAREKVKTLYFVDEIEVYLGYQNKLKQPLELTSVTAEMRFFGVSGVTESDLQSAEIQVKTAENSLFAKWILQWEPLRKVLERTAPASWEALCEKKISDYENTYQILSDTELKPAGLVGNTDAERTIGARAMESVEKAFLDGLQPLAANMLGRYLKPGWS